MCGMGCQVRVLGGVRACCRKLRVIGVKGVDRLFEATIGFSGVEDGGDLYICERYLVFLFDLLGGFSSLG